MADEPPFAGTSVRQRSTRDRPAKAPLSLEAIVDAALLILRSEGLDAVSMRRVAGALDTGAASLYVYVANREGLLQAMLDRVTAMIALEPPDPSRWREQLHALFQRMRDALRDHPGLAALTMADPPTTETVLTLTENMVGILLAGGLDPQGVAWGCDMLVMLVVAYGTEEDVRRSHARASDYNKEEHIAAIYKTFLELPKDRFPLISKYASQMVAGDTDERFHYAIDVVVDGVVARSAQ